MKIEVLLFAQLKEAYGHGRFFLDLPLGAKIADAVNAALSEPALLSFKMMPLRYAVNEEFKALETVLKDKDQLALLTPVAGG